MAERIAITVNAQPVETTTECSVAAAVMKTQGLGTHQSVTGQTRGPLCGMGVCFECRLTINGTPQQRSCQTLCQAGMRVDTSTGPAFVPTPAVPPLLKREFDVLVIGAGPGGLAAADSAAHAGLSVGLVDDNPHFGGQIWRHDDTKPPTRPSRPSITFLNKTQVLFALDGSTLLADSHDAALALGYKHLILACGAREQFLPFPGWTLPGVFGAGGLQSLVKSGYPIKGQRVIVAGSGPLLLAVAEYLRQRGADVRLIAEQTSRWNLARFTGSLLWSHPTKLVEACKLGWRLRGIPFCAGCWPVRAEGFERVTAVTLTDGRKMWSEPCDALACGFGLIANLELPMLLGCAIAEGFVKVDDYQRTSIPNVYAIGELTGIGGLDKAIVEGQIAGAVVSGRMEHVQRRQRQLVKARSFVARLAEAFALREELHHLADRETIVCRCEDVTFAQLSRHANGRDAKLQTRCGMGPCQGRVCGPAVEFLFGWTSDSVRPPIFPTSLGNLAGS